MICQINSLELEISHALKCNIHLLLWFHSFLKLDSFIAFSYFAFKRLVLREIKPLQKSHLVLFSCDFLCLVSNCYVKYVPIKPLNDRLFCKNTLSLINWNMCFQNPNKNHFFAFFAKDVFQFDDIIFQIQSKLFRIFFKTV